MKNRVHDLNSDRPVLVKPLGPNAEQKLECLRYELEHMAFKLKARDLEIHQLKMKNGSLQDEVRMLREHIEKWKKSG